MMGDWPVVALLTMILVAAPGCGSPYTMHYDGMIVASGAEGYSHGMQPETVEGPPIEGAEVKIDVKEAGEPIRCGPFRPPERWPRSDAQGRFKIGTVVGFGPPEATVVLCVSHPEYDSYVFYERYSKEVGLREGPLVIRMVRRRM